jgi:predicted lipoprotein with Yx(FWY)xxD motif
MMFGLAVLMIVAAGSLSAAQFSNSAAFDGYSEAMGMALPFADRQSANASNCYDACAAIWGEPATGSSLREAFSRNVGCVLSGALAPSCAMAKGRVAPAGGDL